MDENKSDFCISDFYFYWKITLWSELIKKNPLKIEFSLFQSWGVKLTFFKILVGLAGEAGGPYKSQVLVISTILYIV